MCTLLSGCVQYIYTKCRSETSGHEFHITCSNLDVTSHICLCTYEYTVFLISNLNV